MGRVLHKWMDLEVCLSAPYKEARNEQFAFLDLEKGKKNKVGIK